MSDKRRRVSLRAFIFASIAAFLGTVLYMAVPVYSHPGYSVGSYEELQAVFRRSALPLFPSKDEWVAGREYDYSYSVLLTTRFRDGEPAGFVISRYSKTYNNENFFLSGRISGPELGRPIGPEDLTYQGTQIWLTTEENNMGEMWSFLRFKTSEYWYYVGFLNGEGVDENVALNYVKALLETAHSTR